MKQGETINKLELKRAKELQEQEGARGIFKLAVASVLLAIYAAVMTLCPRHSEQILAPVQTAQVEQPVPVAVTLMEPLTEPAVAPETEAALAQFGLSATSVSRIVVVAQARPPVILPNPLNRKTQ